MRLTILIVLVPVSVLVAVPVGAVLGVEGRLLALEPGAEPHEPVFEHVVGADPQPSEEDLRRGVAVAEVPGQPGEAARVRRQHLDHGLGRGTHEHAPPVLEREPIALVQMPRLGQVEEDRLARIGPERQPPSVAVVVGERHGVQGRPPGSAPLSTAIARTMPNPPRFDRCQ